MLGQLLKALPVSRGMELAGFHSRGHRRPPDDQRPLPEWMALRGVTR